LGHLKVFDDFRRANPPDVSIYVFHTWLVENCKRYFPDQEKVPPVVYLDLWPVSESLAMVYDAVAASQFTQVKSLPKTNLSRKFLEPLTANMDIVSTEGDLWKRWRSRFNPGFSSRNITALLPELIEEALVFIDGLKAMAGENGSWGPMFLLEERTTNLTFDIIVRASLDMRLHEQSNPSGSPLKLAMNDQIRMMGMMSNAARGPFSGRMPWHNIAIRRNNRIMREALRPQIEAKIKAESELMASQKKTVVDLAIKHIDKDDPQAPRSKPDAEFVEMLESNLKAFLFAGHDTTATTICFMTKCLRDNPACLAKLRAEHDAVIGDPDKVVEVLSQSPHLLYSLPYTLGCIKETLRLYPLAASVREGFPGFYVTARGSDTQYPLEGFGPWVAAPGIQQNPDYWPRPKEFIPERWTVPEGDPMYPVKEAWVPFSFGKWRHLTFNKGMHIEHIDRTTELHWHGAGVDRAQAGFRAHGPDFRL
jgi:cytochrome P450